MDNIDLPHESIEHADHGKHQSVDTWNIKSAMLIAAFAATAVLVEMSANDAQTGYLAAHIAASDTWAQYQAKSVRRAVYLQSTEVLRALHSDSSRIHAMQHEADRMASEPGKDGMQQLAEHAHADESERDHEYHLFNGYERSVRGLQIAVVLTSLFIATRLRWLVIVSATLGAISAISALAVGLGLF